MPQLWQWITPTTGATVIAPVYTLTPASTTASTTAVSPWVSLVGYNYELPQTAPTTSSIYTAQNAAMLQQLCQQAQEAAYQNHLQQRYGPGLYRPLQHDRIHRPAIITHQEEQRRDEALYRRALAECNDQEAARILCLIEQREQTEAAQREALQAQQQRSREERQQRQAARDRAQELLLEHLTPAQRDSFTALGWFIVEGGKSKTKYRIHNRSVAGNIDVLDKHDRVTHRLCCHSRDGSIPAGDNHLSQKIMLELAEDDFLRVANRHAV